MSVRYRAAESRSLRIVPLDLLTVIYHRPSGQTHLVESPVPELIEALGGEAMDVAVLLDHLSHRYDLADPDPAALTARLEELCDVGLVARV